MIYYHTISYYNNPRDAANKEEFCNLTILWDEQQWGQINKVIKSIGMFFCIGIIFFLYTLNIYQLYHENWI